MPRRRRVARRSASLSAIVRLSFLLTLGNRRRGVKEKSALSHPPSLSLPRCALALPLVSLSLGIAPSAIVLDHPESIMNRGFQDRPNPISVGAASTPTIAGVI